MKEEAGTKVLASQLCGGGTTKSNSNELSISVPLSFYDLTHFHGIMGGLFIEKIKRRHEWIKNITAKSYGRKINTWC